MDPRTNTLVLSDLQPALDRALTIVAALDAPQPQVEIEARIVQTSRDFARAIGVQWGLGGRVAPDLGNTTPLAFPNSGSITGRTGRTQGPSATPTAVDLGIATGTTAIGLALGAVNGAFSLDVALTALERGGHGRLLSTPRVATQNNVEAEITQGVQIPIQTVANNTVTVTFKDAALSLKVTPQITSAEHGDHADHRRERIARLQPRGGNGDSADRHAARDDAGARQRRRDHRHRRHLREPRAVGIRTHARLCTGCRCSAGCSGGDAVQDESRELLIFITPRIIRL